MADDDTAPVMGLRWGLKQSFRNYVQSVGGRIEAAAGAERDADGTFSFSPAPDSRLSLDANGAPHGRAAFLGEVRFEGHGGMLSVCIADPVLEIGPAGASLSVADSHERTRRIEIARLDMAAMVAGEDGDLVVPAALAMDGVYLLDGHYPSTTPLDPVRLMLGRR